MQNLGPSPSLPKPLFFCHIPKTGGTSLTACLKNFYRPQNILSDGGYIQLEFLRSQRHRLAESVFIYGHAGHGVLNYLSGRARTIVFLRNPADQAVSNYLHTLDDPANPLHEDAVKYGFTEFMTTQWYYALFQTGSLSATITRNSPAKPIEVERMAGDVLNLLENLFFVGILDRLEESCSALSHLLKISAPLAIPHQNTSRDRGISTREIAALHLEYEDLRSHPAISHLIALEETIYRKAVSRLDRSLKSTLVN